MPAHQITIPTRKVIIYGLLVVASALTLVSGFFIEKDSEGVMWREMVGHLLTEIAIAGFVGFILALTFERLSADEFRKLADEERDAIKQDVFHYVFGYGIPTEITKIIEKQILKTPFVRRNMRVEYTLEVVSAPDMPTKYVRATRELNYEVENLSDHKLGFPAFPTIDLAPVQQLSDEAKFLFVRATGCEKPFEYNEAELKSMHGENRVEKFIALEDKIVVLPGKDRKTHVTIGTQTIKHLDGGILYLILNNHTCDLDLSIFVPTKELDVVVGTTSDTTDNELVPTHRHKPQSGRHHWMLEHPLLAYQGVYVTWMPAAAHVTPPAAVAVVPKGGDGAVAAS